MNKTMIVTAGNINVDIRNGYLTLINDTTNITSSARSARDSDIELYPLSVLNNPFVSDPNCSFVKYQISECTI